MAGAVPGRVTEMPATAQPKRAAASGVSPRASAAAKPPLKASPAPAVSTTGPALKAGRCSEVVLPCSSTPFSPSVISAVPTPLRRNTSAARRASSGLATATPVLAKYAQRRPVTYLAVAAAAGALVVIARPWRMLSVSGLALAALRSPQLSGALISALYGTGSDEGAAE